MKTCMGKGKDRRTRSCSNSGQYLQKQHLNLTPSVPLSADQYPYVLVKRWTASDNPEYQQWLKSPHYTRIIACFTIFYHQIVILVTSTNSSLAGSGAGKRFFSSVLSHLCSELFLTQLQLTVTGSLNVSQWKQLFSPQTTAALITEWQMQNHCHVLTIRIVSNAFDEQMIWRTVGTSWWLKQNGASLLLPQKGEGKVSFSASLLYLV